jgi:hypothetical protein
MTIDTIPELTTEQKTMHKLMFVAVCKLLSDQSTYLQNELKYDLKRDFNNIVRRTDELVYKIESGLSAESVNTLQEVVDELNNAMGDLRNQINEIK